jgi:hypothetical protein
MSMLRNLNEINVTAKCMLLYNQKPEISQHIYQRENFIQNKMLHI